ncbi:MAG: pilus assembly protein [Moritella sp.]|uniref:TadE/TadG family type IV pilus assembly protein n=1 Tax=Moritella sp. TaxID=78556 RepID=UPI0029A1CA8B|nr:TadE family protein [Moritella sp.]MDX2321759.1 pilus assembly protein [Moritella sp.]
MIKSNHSKQQGLYAVEFAIVGSLFFLLLFAVLEIGRLFFVWNVLTEVTRRGARLATVCYLDTANVAAFDDMISTALFNNNTIISDLSASNLQIQYLKDDGTQVLSSIDTNFIEFVKVDIVNYQHSLLIPGLSLTLDSPSFSTTLPRESLGVTPLTTTLCTPT